MIMDQMRKGGQQFTLRQITGCSKDNNRTGSWQVPILPDSVRLQFASSLNMLCHKIAPPKNFHSHNTITQKVLEWRAQNVLAPVGTSCFQAEWSCQESL